MSTRSASPGGSRSGSRRRPDLLDPAALARLGGLEFLARKVVEGFLLGLHRSPHRGFSAEFAELRGYQPGDDLRYIDWRMYARSDRFYVKQFEEETNLRGYILLDVSDSMGWSSDPDGVPPKVWYGKLLAAALAHVLLRQGDAVGLVAFDQEVRARVAPRGGQRQWREILTRLEELEAGGETEAKEPLREVASRLRRRGLVILVSDLLLDPDPTRSVLRFLRHRGHEVLVFHLLDPGERELTAPAREVRYYDPESGDEIHAAPADLRHAYRSAVREALEEWRRSLVPHGIEYRVLETSTPFTLGLRDFLRKRSRLG